jgi:hypothetical protein
VFISSFELLFVYFSIQHATTTLQLATGVFYRCSSW